MEDMSEQLRTIVFLVLADSHWTVGEGSIWPQSWSRIQWAALVSEQSGLVSCSLDNAASSPLEILQIPKFLRWSHFYQPIIWIMALLLFLPVVLKDVPDLWISADMLSFPRVRPLGRGSNCFWFNLISFPFQLFPSVIVWTLWGILICKCQHVIKCIQR